MILGFVVWSIVAALLAGIGLSCLRAQKAVGFFAFVDPPRVKDVPRYNRAVAVLWFVAAGVLEMLGVPLLFLEQNSVWFLLVMLAVLLWCAGLTAGYMKIATRHEQP